jgi:hypothetical protein
MKYFLAHNEVNIFHYSSLADSQTVTSAQPFLEYFNTEEELMARLLELNQEYISTTLINQSGL